MCIILVKPRGKALPSKQIFKNCFESNPDGCGYMYVENNKVRIVKGFMSYKNMYKRLKSLGDRTIVVHFRIGTHGKNDQKTCHPYPITNDTKLLQSLRVLTDVGMVHNGIIHIENDTSGAHLNDTQMYIKTVLSVAKFISPTFYQKPEILNLLEENIYGNKLCFLDKDEHLYYIGKFIESNGILYSNTSYLDSYKTYLIPYKYKKTEYNHEYNYDGDRDTYYDDYIKEYAIKEEDEDYDDYEINYDNYTELQPGWCIQTKALEFITVLAHDDYGMDDRGNVFRLQVTGFPYAQVLYRDCCVFDENFEEVIL